MRVCRNSKKKLRRRWLETLHMTVAERIQAGSSRWAVAWRVYKCTFEVCDVLDCEAIAERNTFYRCYSKKASDTMIVSVCDAHRPVPCTTCGAKSDPIGYVRRCYACQKPYCKTDKRKMLRDPHTNRRRCCKPKDCYSWKCEHSQIRVAKCGWRADDPNAKQCEKWGCDCRLNEFTL